MSPELLVVGDVVRWVDVGLSLALVFTCAWSAWIADHWDHKVRFVIFAAFGALLTSGHLATLGRAWSWRLPALVPVVALALVTTLIFVRRELRARRDGG